MVDGALALQLDMFLQVMEYGVHGGLGMSRNQKIIDIHANNLESFLGVPGEKTRINGAGFEIQKLQLAGFMREPFKAGLAETIVP